MISSLVGFKNLRKFKYVFLIGAIFYLGGGSGILADPKLVLPEHVRIEAVFNSALEAGLDNRRIMASRRMRQVPGKKDKVPEVSIVVTTAEYHKTSFSPEEISEILESFKNGIWIAFPGVDRGLFYFLPFDGSEVPAHILKKLAHAEADDLAPTHRFEVYSQVFPSLKVVILNDEHRFKIQKGEFIPQAASEIAGVVDCLQSLKIAAART